MYNLESRRREWRIPVACCCEEFCVLAEDAPSWSAQSVNGQTSKHAGLF